MTKSDLRRFFNGYPRPLFTTLLSLAAALLFGMTPALLSTRVRSHDTLKDARGGHLAAGESPNPAGAPQQPPSAPRKPLRPGAAPRPPRSWPY